MSRFLMLGALALCMAPAGEGGAGGGGGGEGGGDGGSGGEAPKPLTTDDVNKLINSAFDARGKRWVGDVVKQVSTSLDERFAKFGETFQPKKPEGDEDASGKRVDPKMLKLEQEHEQMKKTLEGERKARLDAEAKARGEKVRTQLHGALAKHVRPEAVGVLLKAFSGDVSYDDQGEPQMALADGSGVTTIDAWVENWAKSPDANLYKPAPSNGGAGTTRNTQSSNAPVSLNGRKIEQLSDEERERFLKQ